MPGGNLARGCGRTFARAETLSQHLVSMTGRICIKPLLEDEKAERQTTQSQEIPALQDGVDGSQTFLQPHLPSIGTGDFALPAALSQQYPLLQDFQDIVLPDEAEQIEDLGTSIL
jgi:hypothetical protein